MKKIFLLIILIFMFPIIVSADECTDEQLKSYKTYVNSVKYDVRQLGDSDTYEVWASNVTGGLALDHGRIVFDSGFLGYATAGQKFTVRVYVADGSSCAGTTISNIDVKIPEPIEDDECDFCEEETTPPTVVEKPSTNTEVEKPSTNTETQKPTTDNSTTIQKPTVDDNTSVEKPNTNDSTTVEKPSTEIDDSETNIDTPSDDNSDNESNVDSSLNEETTDIPNIDDTQENKSDGNVKDIDVADNKIRDALIFAGVSILFIILVLIYNLKRKRNLK